MVQSKIRKVFVPPVVLNKYGEEDHHRSETWVELFIDLFYVAIFLKLGDYIFTCGINPASIHYIASVFLGVYMAKFDFDQYMNKFANDDMLHKLFFLVYSFGLVLIALNVNSTYSVSYCKMTIICIILR
jgi:low temperature requirement protein LtrA